ncbi:hypothetical protein CYMTET_23624 [Cymbomonas tetramitiformis]|uniref:Uncharacterized protein n=1 Tax=Cymbomonas tetramitiformis TaxID=36881 RepID=A0AAE0FXK9_9CHLO|nr:hypothetical protein CYMTET_23624 [Cymbomonas tetramitiformis]
MEAEVELGMGVRVGWRGRREGEAEGEEEGEGEGERKGRAEVEGEEGGGVEEGGEDVKTDAAEEESTDTKLEASTVAVEGKYTVDFTSTLPPVRLAISTSSQVTPAELAICSWKLNRKEAPKLTLSKAEMLKSEKTHIRGNAG